MTAQEVLEELSKAKKQNRLKRKLTTFCKPHLLAIDEIGYESFSKEYAGLFFSLIAARYEKLYAPKYSFPKTPKKDFP